MFTQSRNMCLLIGLFGIVRKTSPIESEEKILTSLSGLYITGLKLALIYSSLVIDADFLKLRF